MPMILLLEWRIIEQLLDQIHVPEQHAATAVALQAQRIQSVTEMWAASRKVIIEI